MQHLPDGGGGGSSSCRAAITGHLPRHQEPRLQARHAIDAESERNHHLQQWMKFRSVDHHFHHDLAHQHVQMGCRRLSDRKGSQHLYHEGEQDAEARGEHHVLEKPGFALVKVGVFRFSGIGFALQRSKGDLPLVAVKTESVCETEIERIGNRKEGIPEWYFTIAH